MQMLARTLTKLKWHAREGGGGLFNFGIILFLTTLKSISSSISLRLTDFK